MSDIFKKIDDPNIFTEAYKANVKPQGKWKKRTEEEIQQLGDKHWALSESDETFGGCSLTEIQQEIHGEIMEGILIECLWRNPEKTGQGIGKRLLEAVKKTYPSTPIFGYSNNGVFKENGFNPIEGITSEVGTQLWIYSQRK